MDSIVQHHNNYVLEDNQFLDLWGTISKECSTFIVLSNVDMIFLINSNEYAFSNFDNVMQWMRIKQDLSFMNQILSNAE